MNRIMLGLAALLVSAPALALDPYMVGIGPKLGTTILPGSYPIKYPNVVEDDRDEDNEIGVGKVKGDGSIGVDMVYYVNHRSRVGLEASAGFGSSHYRAASAMLRYDVRLGPEGAIDFLAGGGIGVGQAWFGEADGSTDYQLITPTYPIKGHVSGLIRDRTRAYQLSLFARLDVPGNSRYIRPVYDATTDTTTSVETDEVGIGVPLGFGADITVFFGDWEPPRPRSASR